MRKSMSSAKMAASLMVLLGASSFAAQKSTIEVESKKMNAEAQLQKESAKPTLTDKQQDLNRQLIVSPCASADHHYKSQKITDLVNKGAQINAQDSIGYTALHWACELSTKSEEEGRCAVVQTLLDHKADMNLKNKSGDDAITSSAFYDNQCLVELLLKNNACLELAYKNIADNYLKSSVQKEKAKKVLDKAVATLKLNLYDEDGDQ